MPKSSTPMLPKANTGQPYTTNTLHVKFQNEFQYTQSDALEIAFYIPTYVEAHTSVAGYWALLTPKP